MSLAVRVCVSRSSRALCIAIREALEVASCLSSAPPTPNTSSTVQTMFSTPTRGSNASRKPVAPGSVASPRAATPLRHTHYRAGSAVPAGSVTSYVAGAGTATPSRSRRNAPSTSVLGASGGVQESFESLPVGTFLVKDEIHSVETHTRLPVEVARVLEGCDPYKHAVAAELDDSTRFAFVVTSTKCLVWCFASVSTALERCFVNDSS